MQQLSIFGNFIMTTVSVLKRGEKPVVLSVLPYFSRLGFRCSAFDKILAFST